MLSAAYLGDLKLVLGKNLKLTLNSRNYQISG